MLSQFLDHLESTGLVPPGARVLLGYSGGADSTCLLHLMKMAGFDIVAAHLHHGQRPEAEHELDRCSSFAEEISVPFLSGRADVPALARDTKTSIEEAGRNARYAFFQTAMLQTGCNLVATAHTLDDHVETVLLNLTRGTGLSGLTGIHARRHEIVRPLLAFTRAETRAYCESHGLWFHDDPANFDVANARTRIRHRVAPELETLNPKWAGAVARLAEIASEEDSFLDALAVSNLAPCERQTNGRLWFLTKDCEASFDKAGLLATSPVLLRRAVRLVVEALGGQLDYAGTLGLVESLASSKGSWTALGGHVVVEWDEKDAHFRQTRPDEPFRFPMTVPGETESQEFDWVLSAQYSQNLDFGRDRGSLEACLDPEALKGSLYFRTAQAGEAITPIGFKGTRKLSDMFQETGLTLAARRRLPVVCDFIGPVWVPGVALADRVKMTENSQRALRMKLAPSPGTSGTSQGVYA
ncbi:MAG: tRNA lysidine(34) synthetase TilS [Armatimonadetes bacterium]|nr:tRNA lysidine(34) synthetase TilS [Armatimonadota bacterium]